MTIALIAIAVVYIAIAAILYIKMLQLSKTDDLFKYSSKLQLALGWPTLIVIFAMALWSLVTTKQKG